MITFSPIIAKQWKQHELWDGTYTIDDFFDIVEALNITDMNQKIAEDYYKRKAEMESSSKTRR